MSKWIVWVLVGALLAWPLIGIVAGLSAGLVAGVALAVLSALLLGTDAARLWRLIEAGVREPRAATGVPDPGALRSRAELIEAMALHGGDVAALGRARRREHRAAIEYRLWQSLILWGVVGGFWLWNLGALNFLPVDAAFGWVALIIAPAAILAARLATGLRAGAIPGRRRKVRIPERAGTLGLEMVELPDLALAREATGSEAAPGGQTVVHGTRWGRGVEVILTAGKSLTVVGARVPAFRVRSRKGRLAADRGAPKAVAAALEQVPTAKRWREVEVRSGDGVVIVQRSGRTPDGWVYDLWLAERLLEALE